MATTEAWMRGPVEGIEPLLMPVAHALRQVREDLERMLPLIPRIDRASNSSAIRRAIMFSTFAA